MTDLISGISGQLLQKIMVSTLLPVVVFMLVIQIPLLPVPAQEWGLFSAVEQLEPAWRVGATTLMAVLLATLLYVLNEPLMRLYQGYPWLNSWLGQRLVRRHQALLAEAKMREEFLRQLRRTLRVKSEAAATPDERIGELAAWEADLGRLIFAAYPKPGSILPTRLGNVIRGFENYPYKQYRMSSFTMRPRLVAKIPESFAKSIDEAKARFDFVLNSSFLSLLLALILFAQSALRPASVSSLIETHLKALACLLLAFVFYKNLISRAMAWGMTDKSAFDLFRLELLKDLGYRQVPDSLVEERRLWSEIRFQMQFGDPADASPNLRYVARSQPSVYAFAEGFGRESFEISRGVKAQRGGARRFFLRIKNVDAGQRDATSVEVVDTVPEGFDFRWDSVELNGKTIRATGSNPYHFPIGALGAGREVTLSYLADRRTPN